MTPELTWLAATAGTVGAVFFYARLPQTLPGRV